jgi:hypothetical protein
VGAGCAVEATSASASSIEHACGSNFISQKRRSVRSVVGWWARVRPTEPAERHARSEERAS